MCLSSVYVINFLVLDKEVYLILNNVNYKWENIVIVLEVIVEY